MLAMPHDVAVLGLGHMGSALARLLLERGLATKVWNRTSEKAAPLVAAGAQAVTDPGAAVAGTPLAVICLERYEHVQGVLEQAELAGSLSGRSIVNVTWGTPEEARSMSRWVQERGGSYLDGNVYDYPANLGPDSAGLSYAGDRAVFDAHEQVLSALGRPQYEGPDPALPNILGSSAGIYHHVALAAFYEAAAYAAHFGVAPSTFLEFNERRAVPLTSHGCKVAVEHLESGDFSSDQAAMRTHFDSMLVNRADMHRIGQPAIMLGAFCDVLERVAEGKGHLALAAAYEDLSPPRS
jgi:3-hydroxyisobutyrate dehydrogenase-like beta-hydroxyacid dehydrogenase